MELTQVVLGLGSNMGDRLQTIKKAIELIREEIGSVLQVSKIYENPAQGFESATPFLNCCLEIETSLKPEELLKKTQQIEAILGRKPKTSDTYTSRPIDVDILFYGSHQLQLPDLEVPHPHFRERIFVLVPLMDLNPHRRDPITRLTINQLLLNCNDKSPINIFRNE